MAISRRVRKTQLLVLSRYRAIILSPMHVRQKHPEVPEFEALGFEVSGV
jgi:hypothetical protein